MNNKLIILTCSMVSALLIGCSSGSDSSPFVTGGGSSSNIISSSNFSIGTSDLNPKVLEFSIGSITPTTSTTANLSDNISVVGSISAEITATAADNSGALVNTGTVNFATQYGTLSATSCTIQNGVCSVTWQSTTDLARLTDITGTGVIDIVNNITAWTTGAEGFTDADGNKILSSSPLSAPLTQTYAEIFIDTDSPYLDRNDNNSFDIGIDNLLTTSIYSLGDTVYNGVTCDINTRSDCSLANIPIYATLTMRLNFDSSTVTAFNVVINTPANGTSVTAGTNINFTATATDPGDGIITGTDSPIAGDDIIWTSTLNGTTSVIGASSSNINISTLANGTHTITVTAQNSNSNTVTNSISITITP